MAHTHREFRTEDIPLALWDEDAVSIAVAYVLYEQGATEQEA